MSGYFNLELNPDQMPVKATHTLNRRYKGAARFEMRAPDAAGTLIVWARDEAEARDHLVNALFEMIFRSARNALSVSNPACPHCGGKTHRHGRNSSGKRTWHCLNAECQSYFVLDRVWRGGINHPSATKKPQFARLLLSGTTVADAARSLGVKVSTAIQWAAQVAANNPERMDDLKCPCGRHIRHRGSCWYRQHLPAPRERSAAGSYMRRTHGR